VRNVMRTDSGIALPSSLSLTNAMAELDDAGAARALVVTGERLMGIVTRSAVVEARTAGRDDAGVGTIVQPVQVHVHPDHRMDVLFERWKLADGLLPVVARDDDARLEGIVTIDEITGFLSSPDLGDFERAQSSDTDRRFSSGRQS
jgi:CBS domain-containing protein